jgi:hypothetical protein
MQNSAAALIKIKVAASALPLVYKLAKIAFGELPAAFGMRQVRESPFCVGRTSDDHREQTMTLASDPTLVDGGARQRTGALSMGRARNGVGKARRDRMAEIHEPNTLGAQPLEWPVVFGIAVATSIIASPRLIKRPRLLACHRSIISPASQYRSPIVGLRPC